MTAIQRNSPVPRYYQLKEILQERVRSGEWQPGNLIPSERELSETYGISRMTARQAITDLVNEGIFYREQGKGTFVTQRKITQQLMRLTGFTEDISARGQQPSTKVLSARMSPADEGTAEHLGIAPGTLLFCLQRLRLADGEPLAIELSQISFKGCERLVGEDLEHQSLTSPPGPQRCSEHLAIRAQWARAEPSGAHVARWGERSLRIRGDSSPAECQG